MALSYGCNKALPEGVRLAWGARLIAPDDLLHDRQSWTDEQPPQVSRTELAEWLNGGALRAALERSRGVYGARMVDGSVWDGASEVIITLYEDEHGVIKGSPQGSHGYVYIAGWLHKDAVQYVEVGELGVGDTFAWDGHGAKRCYRVAHVDDSRIEARDEQFSAVTTFWNPEVGRHGDDRSWHERVRVLRRAEGSR